MEEVKREADDLVEVGIRALYTLSDRVRQDRLELTPEYKAFAKRARSLRSLRSYLRFLLTPPETGTGIGKDSEETPK